jgi:hypothetical protein
MSQRTDLLTKAEAYVAEPSPTVVASMGDYKPNILRKLSGFLGEHVLFTQDDDLPVETTK